MHHPFVATSRGDVGITSLCAQHNTNSCSPTATCGPTGACWLQANKAPCPNPGVRLKPGERASQGAHFSPRDAQGAVVALKRHLRDHEMWKGQSYFSVVIYSIMTTLMFLSLLFLAGLFNCNILLTAPKSILTIDKWSENCIKVRGRWIQTC